MLVYSFDSLAFGVAPLYLRKKKANSIILEESFQLNTQKQLRYKFLINLQVKPFP